MGRSRSYLFTLGSHEKGKKMAKSSSGSSLFLSPVGFIGMSGRPELPMSQYQKRTTLFSIPSRRWIANFEEKPHPFAQKWQQTSKSALHRWFFWLVMDISFDLEEQLNPVYALCMKKSKHIYWGERKPWMLFQLDHSQVFHYLMAKLFHGAKRRNLHMGEKKLLGCSSVKFKYMPKMDALILHSNEQTQSGIT